MEHLDNAIEKHDYVEMDKVLKKYPFLRKYKYMVLYFREACYKDDIMVAHWVWTRTSYNHMVMAQEGYLCAKQHKKYEMMEWIEGIYVFP